MLRRSMSIRNNSIAAPKNYSPQSVPKNIHRRARRERREKAEKITCDKGVYAAPEYVDPKQFHCRPQELLTAERPKNRSPQSTSDNSKNPVAHSQRPVVLENAEKKPRK